MSFAVPDADPGEDVVLSANMTVPPARDAPLISYWRLYDDRNIPFGDLFWVKLYSLPRPGGLAIVPFSQNDPRWREHILGDGPKTFGEFGCLVTDMSMMLNRFAERYDPLQLNDLFLTLPEGQGFVGSEIYFAAPANAFAHLTFFGNFRPLEVSDVAFSAYDPHLISHINEELTNGQGVILQVDIDPADPYNVGVEQHWLLAVARQGDDYLVIDPLDGRAVSLRGRYGRQSRPQLPEQALKETILSALIYRSSHVSEVDNTEMGDQAGHSDLGRGGDL
jgi:hypothetical protein